MQQLTKYLRASLLIVGLLGLLSGCSSGGSAGEGDSVAANQGVAQQPQGPPDVSSDAPALELGPEVAVIETPAGTDLKVAYSDASLQESISTDYIVSEWQNMKLCLETAQPAPYILVVKGYLDSVASDDVLFNFEGRRLAAATWNRDGVNVIRVSSFDFDGSQGNAGFHLRSIIGRYLWTLSELPVRDYNIGCASSA